MLSMLKNSSRTALSTKVMQAVGLGVSLVVGRLRSSDC